MTGGTLGRCCPPPAGDPLLSWAASAGLGLLLHQGLGFAPQLGTSGQGEAGPGAGGQPSAWPWGLSPPPPAPVPAGAQRADRAWDRKSAEKQPGLQTSERGLEASPGRDSGLAVPLQGKPPSHSGQVSWEPCGTHGETQGREWLGGMCRVQVPLGSPGLCSPPHGKQCLACSLLPASQAPGTLFPFKEP